MPSLAGSSIVELTIGAVRFWSKAAISRSGGPGSPSALRRPHSSYANSGQISRGHYLQALIVGLSVVLISSNG